MKKVNFTLIEILGVIVLIVILAAIGIASYMYAVESSKESATKATIERITAGVDGLNNSNGLMLKTLSGSKTEFVNITFNPDPNASDRLKFGDNKYESTDDLEKAYKAFAKAIDGETIQKHVNNKFIIVDGWGNPILIRYPGYFNKGGIDIISPGADGKFGKDGKDTVPLDKEQFRDEDGNWICDDIANF